MTSNDCMEQVERVEPCNCCKPMLQNLLATSLKMWLAKVKAGSKCYLSFEGIYDDTKLMNALFDCYGQLKYCRECVILYLNISPTTLKKMYDYVKSNPCPYRFRIKNEIRSAHYKLTAKRDFFDYIIRNRRPNTHYDRPGAPMYYLDNRFECIRLPSSSDRHFLDKAEKSLVWHFNLRQLQNKCQTISSRTAHNWMKGEFPHTILSSTQSWLCVDCKRLRKQEMSRFKKEKSQLSGVIEEDISVSHDDSNLSLNEELLKAKLDEDVGANVQSLRHFNYRKCPLMEQHRLVSNQAMDAYHGARVECQLNFAGIQHVAADINNDPGLVTQLSQLKDQYKATIDCDFQLPKKIPHYGYSRTEKRTTNGDIDRVENYALFNVKEHGLDDRHIYICRNDNYPSIHRCDFVISFLDDYVKYHLPTWVKKLIIIISSDNRSPSLIDWLINLTRFGHFRFIRLIFIHPGHGGIATELLSMQFAHKYFGRDIVDVGDLAHLAKEFGTAHVLNDFGIYHWKDILEKNASMLHVLDYNQDVYDIYWNDNSIQINYLNFGCGIDSVQDKELPLSLPLQHESTNSYAYARNSKSLPSDAVANSDKNKRKASRQSSGKKRRRKSCTPNDSSVQTTNK